MTTRAEREARKRESEIKEDRDPEEGENRR